MAVTYTQYYNLGKQLDTSDKFLMSVITDNMDIIDTTMKDNEVDIAQNKSLIAALTDTIEPLLTAIKSVTITDSILADITYGVLAGVIDSTIHGTANTYGVVRCYTLNKTSGAEVYMQIAEFVDGTKKTRYYSSAAWSAWA